MESCPSPEEIAREVEGSGVTPVELWLRKHQEELTSKDVKLDTKISNSDSYPQG